MKQYLRKPSLYPAELRDRIDFSEFLGRLFLALFRSPNLRDQASYSLAELQTTAQVGRLSQSGKNGACLIRPRKYPQNEGEPGVDYEPPGIATPPFQAARTESRNLDTSILRRLLSTDSECVAESTCDEADPVSLAPRCTSVMLADTCWGPATPSARGGKSPGWALPAQWLALRQLQSEQRNDSVRNPREFANAARGAKAVPDRCQVRIPQWRWRQRSFE